MSLRTALSRLSSGIKAALAGVLLLLWTPILVGEAVLFVLSAFISMAMVKLR